MNSNPQSDNPSSDNPPSNNPESEGIEGLGKNEDSHWADYPIDTMMIRHENRTVHDVLRRIDKGQFIMDPDFQRDFIWPEDKQSKLIESVLMRIPLPVFYLGEDQEGKMVVVDGLQRLSTFQRFVNNELRLKLPHPSKLNKKCFDDLSPKLQNRIEDCNLILYVLDDKVPDRARLDIFERVNGGVPLTRQQMRNCLYLGQATRFLKEEAGTEIFIEATGGSLNRKTMRDREFVNRFCAFRLLTREEEYKGDMDDFLAKALKKMNQLEKGRLEGLSKAFRTGLANNLMVFGEHAFRKHTKWQTRRSVLNASLWDVMSTGLSQYPEHRVEERSAALRNAFFRLMKNDEFIDSITYGTSDIKKVRHRFLAAREMFQRVFR
uniref:GmrSD restriction endonucleases N-terminal domain-containing protein n=1 Tax=Candidatus Kentrum sp. FW TaxID=2126338 RepID=A0A450TYI9_9GAMM|nr:MAG: Protein of unknown function DUF262 [Candidatus Kentron sp. FW]